MLMKMYWFSVLLQSFPAGSRKSGCNVIPKDVFIERGSSVQIVCLTSCTHEDVRWKQDNRPDIWHESKRINSSHNVLTLRNFTNRVATLECRRLKTDIVIGGTIIRTYSKRCSSLWLRLMSFQMTGYLNACCLPFHSQTQQIILHPAL